MGALKIDTKLNVAADEDHIASPHVPPRPSPLLGNWADEPWGRTPSEIVADSRKPSQISFVRGPSTVVDTEHNEIVEDNGAEEVEEEEAANAASHVLLQPQAIGEHLEGSMSTEHSEVPTPQQHEYFAHNPYYYHDDYATSHVAPYTHTYQAECSASYGYGCQCEHCVPCQCSDCLQAAASMQYEEVNYYPPQDPNMYQTSTPTTPPDSHMSPKQAKFSPPPPPPAHAAIYANPEAHELIMLRWYGKLVNADANSKCPAPAPQQYSFEEWVSRVNRWWDVKFYAAMNPNSGKQSYRGFHDSRHPNKSFY